LLYSHSVHEGALQIGETRISPSTRSLYFICQIRKKHHGSLHWIFMVDEVIIHTW